MLTCRSSEIEKIALFRSLFHGRDDLYAKRFESVKTGKSGYQPVCAVEWVRGVCEKPRVKCATCPMRQLLPVMDAVIRQHLVGHDEKGRAVFLGIYPLLQNEQCYFAVADFDKADWQTDVRAVRESCARLGLSCAVERSRSGNGAHLWWFFEEPVAAFYARSFVSLILTATLESRPEIGLDSYDRIFPNQDTMPKGGFGNLIALPLQGEARKKGNSVFVDEVFSPYSDQWTFLSSVPRLRKEGIERRVDEAQRTHAILPVAGVAVNEESPDTPRKSTKPCAKRTLVQLDCKFPITVVRSDRLYFLKESLTPELRGFLMRLAAFQNPEFYQAQAMRLNTYGKPRIICCAEETQNFLLLPRGCFDDAQCFFADNKIPVTVQDERNSGAPLDVSFHGTLRPLQQEAARKMLFYDQGILSAGTAFGKTVLAAWMIAQRKVSTLILVNRRQLQDQWVARLSTFLDVPEKEIGRIGAGRHKRTGRMDVALLQTLARDGDIDISGYGYVIVDECHSLSAPTFERVIRRAKARYITGLSATPTRKDGHHPIIAMQCGPIRCRITAKDTRTQQPFEHVVQVRPTRFHLPLGTVQDDAPLSFSVVSELLAADEHRNDQIIRDVEAALAEGRSPVVLTDRRAHLQFLSEKLGNRVKNLIVMRGGMGCKQRRTAMEWLANVPPNEPRLLLATGQYLGEGFDATVLTYNLPISLFLQL